MKKERIKVLVELLCKASTAYYRDDKPIMNDKQYDDLYDELEALENETGFVLSASPTQSVQGEVVEFLEKVEHKSPMLSANKTKELSEINKFIGNKEVVQSWKLDGLTIVAEYKNGLLHRAVTRGNGTIGEDVTHTFKHCINIPAKLKEPVDITFRGECVIPWDTFDDINSTLVEPYSHPRNLASGTLRQLDSMIAKDRRIEYYVFEIVDGHDSDSLIDDFFYASSLGMSVVEHCVVIDSYVCYVAFNPKEYKIPVDGLIYKYNDKSYGKSLGTTGHHPLDMMALKWEDDLYETALTNIEWQTSKTGLINPVAIFEPVDLGGAVTTRATLHNVSYIEDLELGIGDTIQVYRSNMVIPKVHDNLTRSNTWKVPVECPVCGGETKVVQDNDSKVLMCANPNCEGKLLGKLVHAVSKNALNIDGLSEATLERLISLGWVSCVMDIYNLKDYADDMFKLDGFGKRSVSKLLEAIENSKHTTLDRFIYALSIPLIGRTASKAISNHFKGNFKRFYNDGLNGEFDWTTLDDFGDTMSKSINQYANDNQNEVYELSTLMTFKETQKVSNNILSGLVFVITGSLNHYTNRDELKNIIESMGGKVSGSVSAKTNYLINNDTESNSSKNKKAKSLNIPIISEEDFRSMIGE